MRRGTWLWVGGLLVTTAAIGWAGGMHSTVVRDEGANFSFEVPAGSRVERAPDIHAYWVWPSTGGYLRIEVESEERVDPGRFVNRIGPGHLVWATGMTSVVRSRNRHGIPLVEYRALVRESSARCARGSDTVIARGRCDSGWVACEPGEREWTEGPFWVATVRAGGRAATVHIGLEPTGYGYTDSTSACAGRAIVSTIRAIRK